MPYFNHQLITASSWPDRWTFLRRWWRIYESDTRWIPPDYWSLLRQIDPARNPDLARWRPACVFEEAMYRRGVAAGQFRLQEMAWTAVSEVAVAATIALYQGDPTCNTLFLALYRGVNDLESNERLIDHLCEQAMQRGCRRLIGPVDLSPHLPGGVLSSHWNELPPWHTPYDPPYVHELWARLAEPIRQSRLFHFEVPASMPAHATGPARLTTVSPDRLAGDLFDVFARAGGFDPTNPLPDEGAARLLLERLRPSTLLARVAWIDRTAVGFVLLQPDLARCRRLTRGGRSLWGWLAWQACKGRPVSRGRVLLGGVLPEYRGQGIGQQLWQQLLEIASGRGWRHLSLGPVLTDETGADTVPGATATFLQRRGAHARQLYVLYQRSLR